ncbi:predicted protein [Lichtheimia corymbifera JMRC:FSU:9682]|uniref:GATA-type domain-containing protein n=1 Tax=Lichtheimia corymbifera JMRC:FSU:9682 TaxID=1263082 RepID=A0A068S5B5_9FUNG|nr:predicted protein [Lichtheimia corymbifera JMRC:FSU:9682]
MRNNNRYINTDIFDSLFSEIFWQESMDHITPIPPADKVKSTITTSSTGYPKRREATKHYPPTAKTVLSSKKHRRGLCHNCKKTEDSTWRLDPKSKVQLCNACGLYVRNNNVNRKFDQRTDGSSKLIRRYKAGHRKLNEED